MIKLSKRLNMIYDLIPNDSIVADVGTDHGWLIIKTVLMGKTKKAYGLDIADGPLGQARVNVETYNLEDKIELIKMDGLVSFNKPCDTFVIAGMGAETIWSILTNYTFDPQDRIILQSNTHLPWLRKALMTHGFTIVDERFLYDNKKPVFIMVCQRGETTFTLRDQYIGPILKHQTMNEAYMRYLTARYHHLKTISTLNTKYTEEFIELKNFIETE